MRLEAVVFDLDGTLVETAPDLHAVLAELLEREGLRAPPLSAVRTMIGDGAKQLIRRAFAWQNLALEEDRLENLYAWFLERYTEEPARWSAPYPGVPETLAELAARGLRLGVCTNKPQRPSERLLAALGLAEKFAAILGGDARPYRKPDPRHLAATLEALSASPRAAVMVGDSANDVAVARALGIPCVLVSFGYTAVPARELGADRVVDRFDELPDALRALSGSP
ncbi:MAG: phosphoglycolate phosphatase [Geminicoccaceae bacterium]|nr:phosphoglycolate phosphatase [Geminicoccaceae bacterium]MCX7630690.1 phosphoglycolate phosphatase [Geminicoccaceae bacterium]MDW8123229.1 phosphoglycolate phosphatase [Geminicoccaceae bacterium]MDW8340111.1 phosphoglycolate phosphatase [Geminicoccaceae bacterium]